MYNHSEKKVSLFILRLTDSLILDFYGKQYVFKKKKEQKLLFCSKISFPRAHMCIFFSFKQYLVLKIELITRSHKSYSRAFWINKFYQLFVKILITIIFISFQKAHHLYYIFLKFCFIWSHRTILHSFE